MTVEESPRLKSLKDVLYFFRVNVPVLALISVISLIAYINGLGGQFLSADDLSGIINNPLIKNFSQTFGTFHILSIFYSSLLNLFGPNPVVFHLAVLLIHIFNSFLVFLLVYLLAGKRASLYASLLYAVLPTGSEAVFWISGAGYIFLALFSFLCLNLFFIYRITGNRKFLFLFAGLYILSLFVLRTPWMLTLPFITFSLDVFYSGGTKVLVKKSWKIYLALLLGTFGYGALFMLGSYKSRMSALTTDYYFNSSESASLLKRLPYTLYKAVELYIFPIRLSFFQEEVLSSGVYAFMVFVSVLLLGLVVYLFVKKNKSGALILAILASILPLFSPVQVAWFIAERYLYLGGAFFCVLLVSLLFKLESLLRVKNLAPVSLVFLISLYLVRDVTRAADFRSDKALWLATQKTAPLSYRIYNNLGDVYSKEENWTAAISSFQTSIKIKPDYADAIHNLGYTYMVMGDYENAKKYLLESYRKNPRLYQALEKLGKIEYAQGNKEKAKEYFNKVREIYPAFEMPQF